MVASLLLVDYYLYTCSVFVAVLLLLLFLFCGFGRVKKGGLAGMPRVYAPNKSSQIAGNQQKKKRGMLPETPFRKTRAPSFSLCPPFALYLASGVNR
jgi:hypothetical protein